VAFVYPSSRREMIAGWRAGTSPETHLLAVNQLAERGIDAEVHEPAIGAAGTGLVTRLAWHLREVPLPWELKEFDLLFTPLANIVPVTARLRRRPRVLVFNFGLNTILRRGAPWRQRALRTALRLSAGVVCLGHSQREELIELAGLSPEHVTVAIHGVDDRFFAPTGEPPERDLVVAVGKDLARDYETLAAAVRDLPVRVLLVTLRRNLEGVVLSGNVEVRERISDEEVRSLYARAGCVVLPLQGEDYPIGSEGSGITALLEAEAMARPLVASARPIVRDYVVEGETALLVPPRDPTTLRAAIESVLGDAERADALGRAGRALIEERHTMRHMAANLAPLMRAAARGA
jgi:glycosyltransferase involved in cell wall biosynthesis